MAMNPPVDPGTFGLTRSTTITRSDSGRYLIVIRRKSRIVMKDGESILKKVSKIRARVPDARIGVQTRAPVCSKTRKFLEDRGIRVEAI